MQGKSNSNFIVLQSTILAKNLVWLQLLTVPSVFAVPNRWGAKILWNSSFILFSVVNIFFLLQSSMLTQNEGYESRDIAPWNRLTCRLSLTLISKAWKVYSEEPFSPPVSRRNRFSFCFNWLKHNQRTSALKIEEITYYRRISIERNPGSWHLR